MRLKLFLLLVCGSLATARYAGANENIYFGLHARIAASEFIVLERVVNASGASVAVERVFKGNVPDRITLVDYVDGFADPKYWKPLVAGARELLFLRKQGDAYAPVENQNGRLTVTGDALDNPHAASETNSLSEMIATISRLVPLQTQADRSTVAADAAYVTALRSGDAQVRRWALDTAHLRITTPSVALVNALIARWPGDAGTVANAMCQWRVSRAAPLFAKSLASSVNSDERAWAAMALGGTGNRTFLTQLRAASVDRDARVREFAYDGLTFMLGPDSFVDLRRGAKDTDPNVRARAVVSAYNMLELEGERRERRWPPATNQLISEVRAFLTEMEEDPVPFVSNNARSMLASIELKR